MSNALIAILLWSALASLAAQLTRVPPFYLTGFGLCVGGLFLLPQWRLWRVPLNTFLTGVAALFFYHAALFTAFKIAPVVSANLINYLWPLLIVLLASLFDAQQKLTRSSIFAAMLGFAGAALAIIGDQVIQFNQQALLGYLLAFIAAVIWSSYTLQLRRLPHFPSAAVGGFNLLAGGLSLLIATQFEQLTTFSAHDYFVLGLIGLGPMGYAFFCWDKAAKQMASKTLGVLSFITPVLSTSLLLLSSGQPLTRHLAIAALMVLSATAIVLLKPKASAT